jgi:serine/threonine-protein kinase
MADAASALGHAVMRAPGFAMAQAMLGGIMLEAGQLANALTHLEAAESLDPGGLSHIDLPRAYVYADRWDDAMLEYERARQRPTFTNRMFDEVTIARFKMWRGELMQVVEPVPPGTPLNVTRFQEIAARIHHSGTFGPEDRERMLELVNVPNPRMRASRAQFMAEFLLFVKDPEAALDAIRISVDAGLHDFMWIQRCPLLEPLRERTDFRGLAERVAARANAVVAAVHALENPS